MPPRVQGYVPLHPASFPYFQACQISLLNNHCTDYWGEGYPRASEGPRRDVQGCNNTLCAIQELPLFLNPKYDLLNSAHTFAECEVDTWRAEGLAASGSEEVGVQKHPQFLKHAMCREQRSRVWYGRELRAVWRLIAWLRRARGKRSHVCQICQCLFPRLHKSFGNAFFFFSALDFCSSRF